MARQEKDTVDETHEKYGKIAEEVEKACCRYEGKPYMDVTEVKEEQDNDTDIIVKNGLDEYGVEVKGDYLAFITNNVTFEDFTHVEPSKSKKLRHLCLTKEEKERGTEKTFIINEVRNILGITPNGCNNKSTAKYMIYIMLEEKKVKVIENGKPKWVGTKEFKLTTAKGSDNVRIVYDNEKLKKDVNALLNTSLSSEYLKIVRQSGDGVNKYDYDNIIYTIPTDNLDRLDENNSKVYSKTMLDELNKKQITSLSKNIVETWGKEHPFFKGLKVLFDDYHTKDEFIRILYEVYP